VLRLHQVYQPSLMLAVKAKRVILCRVLHLGKLLHYMATLDYVEIVKESNTHNNLQRNNPESYKLGGRCHFPDLTCLRGSREM